MTERTKLIPDQSVWIVQRQTWTLLSAKCSWICELTSGTLLIRFAFARSGYISLQCDCSFGGCLARSVRPGSLPNLNDAILVTHREYQPVAGEAHRGWWSIATTSS